ncbi:MAG: GNAT family N-acetyltransferase [Candidatus Polarisedimenticolia bacterium]
MNLQDLRRDIRNAGLGGALFDIAYRFINRPARFMVLQMMILTPESLAPGFLVEDDWRPRFLDERTLRRHAQDPMNEMTQRFLDQALEKGDRCMAILDDDRLAAYGWYSSKETAVTEDLALRFAPSWVYMYKGFTHPEYRGLRLHARGMASALMSYAEEGRRGLVSFVEANNFNSMRSVHRMGYRDVGRIVVMGALGRRWVLASPRCRALGLSLHTRPPGRPQPIAPV